MEPTTNRKITKDEDANCRLRHGFNIHCLSKIFQYLENVDLYTISGMNEFYSKIINEQIIPNHLINCYKLFQEGYTISQVFDRFGTKIQKFYFEKSAFFKSVDFRTVFSSIEQLICLITHHTKLFAQSTKRC